MRPPAHVVVRTRALRDSAEVAYRLEPNEQGPGAVLLTEYQAQEIVDGLARLGVTARPE